MKRYLIIVVTLLLASAAALNAQKIGLKTNALYWATTTPNLGMEFAISDRFTFEVEGGYNPWTLCPDVNRKAKHFLVSPELRYWFCEAFNGHFIGINGNYTQFNAGGIHVANAFYKTTSKGYFIDELQNSRLEGWAAGGGLTYGYAYPISRRWNMELTLGVSYWYTEYDKYESKTCGLFQESGIRKVVGPTSLGISFIYLIK